MPAKEFFPSAPEFVLQTHHRAALGASAAAGHALYLGHLNGAWQFAEPQHSVMILGPPRSGKTTSLVIPNVMASGGPVVSTSTKPDVLDATAAVRSAIGRCLLFDPTGSVGARRGLSPLRWSPLQSCTSWTAALAAARSLGHVGAATGRGAGASSAEHSHWTERAQSLLAPLLYAGAVEGVGMRTVLAWVDRRRALPAQQILAGLDGPSGELARNLLDGITATEERELSSIWSTASGVLSGYRSDAALAATTDPDFDPAGFVRSSDTVYICAPAHLQTSVAPMVVGLLNDIRYAVYARFAETGLPAGPPAVFALDELANIAPIPDLPSMISEGGGQGLLTLACLQDLSQARQRWAGHADGFPSLFGTTVVLPGIGDVRTLDALSRLAGEEEIVTRTFSSGTSATDHPLSDPITGGRPHRGESLSSHFRRRLPLETIGHGSPDCALAFDDRNEARWVELAPSHLSDPWRSLRGAERTLHHELSSPSHRRAREGLVLER